MAQDTYDDLFEKVPIGEENAIPSLAIWKRFGIWSPWHIRFKLKAMVAAGVIERRLVLRGAGFVNLYFRSTASLRDGQANTPSVAPGTDLSPRQFIQPSKGSVP
jgi:hypothetical protein